MKPNRLCFRILATLKLHAFTLDELAKSLTSTHESCRRAVRSLCDAGLVEKRIDLETENGRRPGLYGLTP